MLRRNDKFGKLETAEFVQQLQSRRRLRRVDLVGNQKGLRKHEPHVPFIHVGFLGQARLGLIQVVHHALHIVDAVVAGQVDQQQHEVGPRISPCVPGSSTSRVMGGVSISWTMTSSHGIMPGIGSRVVNG